MQERLSHGISTTSFPGTGHRVGAGDFQHPYFPPPFPTQQTAQEAFAAAQAPHLVDPYNVNSLHFQTSQVRNILLSVSSRTFEAGNVKF